MSIVTLILAMLIFLILMMIVRAVLPCNNFIVCAIGAIAIIGIIIFVFFDKELSDESERLRQECAALGGVTVAISAHDRICAKITKIELGK